MASGVEGDGHDGEMKRGFVSQTNGTAKRTVLFDLKDTFLGR